MCLQVTARCAGKHVNVLADREPILWTCASRLHGIGPVNLKYTALRLELKPGRERGIAGAWTTFSFFLVRLILQLCQYVDCIMSKESDKI
jgi:hypothetical protein